MEDLPPRYFDAEMRYLREAAKDGLWPIGDCAFSGYRLLLEYFTFR